MTDKIKFDVFGYKKAYLSDIREEVKACLQSRLTGWLEEQPEVRAVPEIPHVTSLPPTDSNAALTVV